MRRSRAIAIVATAIVAAVDLQAVGGAKRAFAEPAPVRPAVARVAVTERPDLVSARRAAKAQGTSVEVTDLRTDRTTTWANPDGTLSADIYPAPVRVRRPQTPDPERDAAGESTSADDWVSVDARLAMKDGRVRPAALPVDLSYSAGGAGTAASVATTDATRAFDLSWPGSLPTPRIEGTSVTYPDVAPGVDFTLDTTRTGFSTKVILRRQVTGPMAFRLPVKLRGMRVAEGSNGQLRLLDSANRLLNTAPPARMWDATIDPVSGDPARSAAVTVKVVTTPAGSELQVIPDQAFLADPSLAYPVTIDPTTSLGIMGDAHIASNNTLMNYGSETELRMGSPDGSTQIRSFVRFGVQAITGKYITSATMKLSNWHSPSCTATPTELNRVTVNWDEPTITWAAQPGAVTAADGYAYAAPSFAGIAGNATCPEGYQNFDITELVQEWADETHLSYGVRLSASYDTARFKKYRSSEYTGSAIPVLSVTYNSYPNTVGGRRPANNAYVPTTQPTLYGGASDLDGGFNQVQYQIRRYDTGAFVWSGYGNSVPAGGISQWQVTAGKLTNGTSYQWQARACENTSFCGAWGTWVNMTVDTTAPATPGVTSSSYPSGVWSGPWTGAGTFNFTSSSDVVGYYTGKDITPPATFTDGTSVTWAMAGGPHTLFVRAMDRAGNLSAITPYGFKEREAGLTSPTAGAKIGRRVTIKAVADPQWSGVRYQYRRGDANSWADVPLGALTDEATGLSVSYPLAITSGSPVPVVWDVQATLGSVDGTVQLRGWYTDASTAYTNSIADVKFSLDHDSSVAAVEQFGPGELNLLTGNYEVSATDAVLEAWDGQFALSRTFLTRDAGAGAAGKDLGPGWTSTVADAGVQADHLGLVVAGSVVTVKGRGSASTMFAEADIAGGTTTYQPELGAEGLTLSKTSIPDEFLLRDLQGTEITFGKPSGSASYVTTHVTHAAGEEAGYEYTVTNGVPRLDRVVAAPPAGVTCTSPATTRGCRSMSLSYATVTTATGTSSAQWGAYAGQLASATITSWNPAKSPTAGMDSVTVASYLFDNAGRLRAAWDPRISPALKTTYSYDTNGVLSTITPAGESPWTLSYATIAGDGGQGRLRKVSRPSLLTSPATAEWTVQYQVPLSGTGAPFSMTTTQLDRWGQSDRPTDATATFPSTQVPSANPPTSYSNATVHYLNASGLEVNTLAPGGHLDVEEFDDKGNSVRELSADNRASALAEGIGTEAEAALAQEIDSDRIYSTDGLELLEAFEPAHDVQRTTGEIVRARRHTLNVYDQNAATGGPYHLVTTSTTGARIIGASSDVDVRTTTTTYEWSLRQPRTVTTDPGSGHLALVSRAKWDLASGLLTSTTLPSGSALENDAHTRKTIYYTAGINSDDPACGSKPEWAHLPCRVGPITQPAVGTGRPEIPTSFFTYNMFEDPVTITEKNSTTTLRTTTWTQDGAGRPSKVNISGVTGTAVPATDVVYSSTTGRLLETRSLDAGGAVTDRLIRVFDSLGRLTSYTDADGVTSTTTYDVASRPLSTNDGKGTQTVTYESATEKRGFPTSLVDSEAGTFTATYNPDGQLATHNYPNGLRATTSHDETGTAVNLEYVKTTNCSTDCTWLQFASERSIHGDTMASNSDLSDQQYDYDAAGRLTRVQDRLGGASCKTRAYAVDDDSNRTAADIYAPTSTGECQQTTPTLSSTYTYDAADRVVDAGFVYDTLGRTLTVPAAYALGTTLTATYYVNDVVRSMAQAGDDKTWTLDVAQTRFRSWTDGSYTKINHYQGDSDSPSWVIISGSSTYTRNIVGLDGRLVAIGAASGPQLNLTNLRGDVVASVGTDPTEITLDSTFEATEFGLPRVASTRRYAWLGGYQRSSDTISGATLMGVRLYLPSLGRFLQTDPVAGGSDNSYDYVGHSPIDGLDLDGRMYDRESSASIRVRPYIPPPVPNPQPQVKPTPSSKAGRRRGPATTIGPAPPRPPRTIPQLAPTPGPIITGGPPTAIARAFGWAWDRGLGYANSVVNGVQGLIGGIIATAKWLGPNAWYAAREAWRGFACGVRKICA